MKKNYDIAVIGLGVMGSSLARNMLEKGFYIKCFSIAEEERKRFAKQAEKENLPREQYEICASMEELVRDLKMPQRVFLMITAGAAVDQVLGMLSPLLKKDAVVMDGGNSWYKDTVRRCRECRERGIHFMGIGISGGEEGARRGPCMMAGADEFAWNHSEKILKAIAAYTDRGVCCKCVGADGAGHYVKMVHNGIEYGILQILAETWQFLRTIQGRQDAKIAEIFEKWAQGENASYLLEISAYVLKKKDKDGTLLLYKILDVADQKGTGKWTLLESVEKGIYFPTVYEAVMAREVSARKADRKKGSRVLSPQTLQTVWRLSPEEISRALQSAIFLCYCQGFELIMAASAENNWEIDRAALAQIWMGGCIIRSRLLGNMEEILRGHPGEPLLFCRESGAFLKGICEMRKLAAEGIAQGKVFSGYMSALQYYDAYRCEKMPVAFIQALRDCFGAHTYRRTDREGSFHTRWQEEGESDA